MIKVSVCASNLRPSWASRTGCAANLNRPCCAQLILGNTLPCRALYPPTVRPAGRHALTSPRTCRNGSCATSVGPVQRVSRRHEVVLLAERPPDVARASLDLRESVPHVPQRREGHNYRLQLLVAVSNLCELTPQHPRLFFQALRLVLERTPDLIRAVLVEAAPALRRRSQRRRAAL